MSYIFWPDRGETPQSIREKRELAALIMGRRRSPQNVGEGFGAIADGIVSNVLNRRAAEAEKAGNASAADARSDLGSYFANRSFFPPAPGGSDTFAAGSGASSQPIDMTGNEVFSSFMDTIQQGGVTNPYALAAIAATGQRESAFSPGNVNRTWSDPSESGQPGQAGGIMSWRGPRYQALAQTGDLSPAGQARYFLQEDPQLIAALNSARSVEEATSLMNNAWKFAGYNRPGGEAAARLEAAQGFLPRFQGPGQPPAVAAAEAMATGQPMPAPPGAFMPALSDASFDERFATTGGPAPEIRDATNLPGAQEFVDNRMAGFAPQSGPSQGGQPVAAAQANFLPEMAGNNPRPAPHDVQMLLETLSNPFLDPATKALASSALEQYVQSQDPSYQLEMDYKQTQMEKMRREMDRGRIHNAGNGVFYNEDTGEWITAPNAGTKDPTSAIQNYQFLLEQGVDPETAMSRAFSGGTTVNVGGAEKGFDKTVGEGYGNVFLEMRNEQQSARRALDALDVMEQSLGQEGFYSGAGGEHIQQLKRFGSALGMDPDGISSMETFNAMSKAAALDAMGGSLGAGFSNADRDFVVDQVPNLGNTVEGNRQLIGIQRKLNQRKMDMAQLARDYAEYNDGRIDAGFDQFLSEWADQNPLFPRRVSSEEDFMNLPSGAEFIAPDGSIRRKP